MSDFKIKCKHCGHFDAPISANSFCDEHCAYCGVEFEAVEIKQAKGIFPNTWTSGNSGDHNHDPRLRAPMYSCLVCDREYLKYELKIKDMLARDFDRTIIKQSVLNELYNKIQELEAFKKEALELIKDYANKYRWWPDRIVSEDEAIEFLKKHEVKE